MGERVGLAGDRERLPAVLLGDDPSVIPVTDPGDLVLHHRAEQPAVEGRLRLAVPGRQLDHLGGVDRLAPAPAFAVLAAEGGIDVDPGPREEVAELSYRY